MPVRIIVSRNRKTSENYNSQGFGLSVDTEFNGDIIGDPEGFANHVNSLFELIEKTLDAKVNGTKGKTTTTTRTRTAAHGNGNGHNRRFNGGRETHGSNGNGNGNGEPRKLTYAQQKAIINMARKLDQDPDEWAEQDHGVPVKELTVKQASQLIDALKHEIEAGETQGAET